MTNSMSDSQPSSQRQQIIDALLEAEKQGKARQIFIRGCSRREDLSTESKRSLGILSSCEAAHVRLSQRLRLFWTMLGTGSPLPDGLVSVTEMLLRENATLSTAIEPWQKRSLFDERSAYLEMWTRLWKSAASIIEDSKTSGGTSNSGSDS